MALVRIRGFFDTTFVWKSRSMCVSCVANRSHADGGALKDAKDARDRRIFDLWLAPSMRWISIRRSTTSGSSKRRRAAAATSATPRYAGLTFELTYT